MPRACLPPPQVDFFALMASIVGGFFFFSYYCYSASGTSSEPWRGAVGLCFTIPPVCCATRGASAFPMGSRTYSFRGFALRSLLVMYFFFSVTNFMDC